MIVRNPFRRLYSSYKEKLNGTNTYYEDLYGKNIIQRFRPNASDKEIETGKPTFHEFVKYLEDETGRVKNNHWAPYFTSCEPCKIGMSILCRDSIE